MAIFNLNEPYAVPMDGPMLSPWMAVCCPHGWPYAVSPWMALCCPHGWPHAVSMDGPMLSPWMALYSTYISKQSSTFR
eukprot:gene12890-biopygen4365